MSVGTTAVDTRMWKGQVATWFATKDGATFDEGTSGGGYLDGNWNAIPNAAAAAESWRVVAPAGGIKIGRLMVRIQGAGVFSGWGTIAALTKGIRVRVSINSVVRDLTKVPWLTHADMAAINYDVQEVTLGGSAKVVVARWTFTKHGAPLILDEGDYVEVVLNDDFSGLVKQSFVFEGKD